MRRRTLVVGGRKQKRADIPKRHGVIFRWRRVGREVAKGSTFWGWGKAMREFLGLGGSETFVPMVSRHVDVCVWVCVLQTDIRPKGKKNKEIKYFYNWVIVFRFNLTYIWFKKLYSMFKSITWHKLIVTYCIALNTAFRGY